MYCSILKKGMGSAGVEPLLITAVRFPASAYGTPVVFFGYSGFFHHVIPRKPTHVLSGSRSYVHKFHEFLNNRSKINGFQIFFFFFFFFILKNCTNFTNPFSIKRRLVCFVMFNL